MLINRKTKQKMLNNCKSS